MNRSLLFLFSLLTCAALCFTGSAQASTITSKTFTVKSSGKAFITCGVGYYTSDKQNMYCDTKLPEIGELDPILILSHKTGAYIGETGGIIRALDKPKTLRSGDTWKRNGFTCSVKGVKLTCKGRKGGFIAKPGSLPTNLQGGKLPQKPVF
jgi:hypothetical protein